MKDTISATEQEQAVRQLMTELEKGRKSGETEGWLTSEEVKQHFQKKYLNKRAKPLAETQAVLLCQKEVESLSKNTPSATQIPRGGTPPNGYRALRSIIIPP